MVYIRAKSCKHIALQLNDILKEEDNEKHELLYYKLMLLTELTCKEIKEEWKEENIPKDYIDKFNVIHEQKMDMWVRKVKNICFSNHTADIKKEELMDTIIILLYKLIIAVHKHM